MADALIITITDVHAKPGLAEKTSGKVFFAASVDGTSKNGPANGHLDVSKLEHHDMGDDLVFKVDLDGKKKVDFSVTGSDPGGTGTLGKASVTIESPFQSVLGRAEADEFYVEWMAELETAREAPSSVQANRMAHGTDTATTISERPEKMEFEVHPVRPNPYRIPRAFRGKAFKNGGTVRVDAGTPVNVVPNPECVPILAKDDASASTCARIEASFYRPASLSFAEKDPRLVWSQTPVGDKGGEIVFFDEPKGRNLLVYGKKAGEVQLEVKFNNEVVDKYRVLVAPLARIRTRVTLLESDKFKTKAQPADVKKHVAIANRLLRQVAVELVLEGDAAGARSGATHVEAGIYRAKVADDLVRNVANRAKSSAVNLDPTAFNIAYIVSASCYLLGEATGIPYKARGVCGSCGDEYTNLAPKIAGAAGANGQAVCPNDNCKKPLPDDWIEGLKDADETIKDEGTPSTSRLEKDGGKHEMKTFLLTGQTVNNNAMLVMTEKNGNPASKARTWGNTLAHEAGHVLRLRHRGAGQKDDGMPGPLVENLMHFIGPACLSMDLDMIQAKAVRTSPLVKAPYLVKEDG